MSKAEELVWKYYHRIEHTLNEKYSPLAWGLAKDYALIAVDEILTSCVDDCSYWINVKKDIEKL